LKTSRRAENRLKQLFKQLNEKKFEYDNIDTPDHEKSYLSKEIRDIEISIVAVLENIME
jgi:hypothetical protein